MLPLPAGSWRLGPAQRRPLQEPVDVAGGDDAHELAVIDYQRATFAAASLGDVEQVGGRVTRADRGHPLERTSDRFDPSCRPSVGRHVFERGQCQEPAEPARLIMGWEGRVPRGEDVAVQRNLDADVVRSLHRIGRHHLGDGDPGQRLADQAAGLLGAGGAQEEPAQEDEPDPTDVGSGDEEGEQAVGNEQEGESHADAGGDAGGSQAIAGALPDQRLQNPPSVQREGGEQVEHAEQDVDVAQPGQGGGQQARVGATAKCDRKEEKHHAQHQAGEGADEGDPRLRTGRAALAAEAGYAAEQPERDALDFHAAAHGDDGVSELMGKQGGQVDEGRDDTRGPVRAGGVAGRGRRQQADREAPGDQRGDDQKAPVEPHVDAGDAAKAHVLVHVLDATRGASKDRERLRRPASPPMSDYDVRQREFVVGTPQSNRGATALAGVPARSALVDRTIEKAALDALLNAVRAGLSGTLVLRGEPGIGKTALLDYATESASDFRLARALGFESEMEFSFAGLHQLVVPFLPRLHELPGPQRDALVSAFGLVPGVAPDRFQVGLATLTLLAAAAAEQPLLCVVDDAQWLDLESAEVLAFVARRLYADRIALLFAVREGAGQRRRLDGLPELSISGIT